MNFDKLIESVRFENVTVFIGSGFSLKAGAPSSSEIVKCFYKHMSEDEYKYVNDDHLSNVSNEFELMYGREKMIEILQEAMKFIPGDLSDQENLVSIPHFKTIITTNYDTLLEDTYGESNCYVVRTTQDCTEIPNDKTVIFKIHGDFKAKENILITKSDYEQSFKGEKEKLLWNVIKSQFLTKDILFIGYSLDDGNIFDIITEINKYTNTHRNCFLIAPSLVRHKRNRLEKAGVIYYDAKAEDFFFSLTESLNKNIRKDFQRKKVSQSSFSKYFLNHKISPVINDNIVERYDTVGPVETKFTCTFDENFIKFIEGKCLPSLFNERLPDSPMPALSIDKSSLCDVSISLNGITICDLDNLQNIYFSPCYKKCLIKAQIPSIDFNEKCDCYLYTDFNNNKALKMVCDIYEMDFSFGSKQKNSFSLKFNSTYKNNSEALKWIEFLIGVVNKEKIILKIIDTSNVATISFIVNNFDRLTSNYLNKLKRYYYNIKRIETMYDVDFKKFDHFSNDLYKKSLLLVNSPEDNFHPFIVNKGDSFSFFVDTSKLPDISSSDLKDKSLILLTRNHEPIQFNGNIFQFKYTIFVIRSLCFYSQKIIDENEVCYTLENIRDTVYMKYTNKKLSDFKQFKKLSVEINF